MTLKSTAGESASSRTNLAAAAGVAGPPLGPEVGAEAGPEVAGPAADLPAGPAAEAAGLEAGRDQSPVLSPNRSQNQNLDLGPLLNLVVGPLALPGPLLLRITT